MANERTVNIADKPTLDAVKQDTTQLLNKLETISNMADTGDLGGGKYVVVTLNPDEAWVNNKQMVSATGVKAGTTEQLLILSTENEVATENIRAFGITIVGNGEGTITFGCEKVPSSEITLTVVIMTIKSV